MRYLENLLGCLLKSGQAEKHPWFQKGWIIATYLWGAWLWGTFFSWGKFPIHFHDWAEVNIARLAYLRDAILKGSLPLHASEIAHLRNGTDQILSVPDLVFSPQILLMRWIDVEFFVLINTIILYTVAFIGFLWVLRRYKLSPIIFSALVLMFNFNGHIISHFSIGHITWWSYFLFPWLFIMIVRLLEDNDHSWRWVTLTSFLIFFIFLQGGYHHYVWSLIFLGILALVAWKHSWTIFKVLVFSNLLSMIRLLPPAPLIGNLESEFISGYPKFENVFSSILFMRQPENSLPFLNFGSNLGYWEFDLFIGKAGALILGFGIIFWLRDLKKNSSLIFTLAPMIVLSVLSIGNLYEPFTNLPIPLIAGERVASRFIILPFVFAMIFSLTALQNWINSLNKPIIIYVFTLALNIYFAIELFVNTMSWKIENVVSHFPYTPVDKSIKIIANHSDPTYTNMLIIGLIITIVSMTILLLLSNKEKLSKKKTVLKTQARFNRIILNRVSSVILTNNLEHFKETILYKKHTLILCTGNSARSQMGEGLLKYLAGDRFEVFSAGTHPSTLNPYAVLAMAELGIDIREQYSKSLNEFINQEFDYVITVCDRAAETCPVFPGPAQRIHWSFPDPAAMEGSHQEKLAAFTQVRDAIKKQLKDWLQGFEISDSVS